MNRSTKGKCIPNPAQDNASIKCVSEYQSLNSKWGGYLEDVSSRLAITTGVRETEWIYLEVRPMERVYLVQAEQILRLRHLLQLEISRILGGGGEDKSGIY